MMLTCAPPHLLARTRGLLGAFIALFILSSGRLLWLSLPQKTSEFLPAPVSAKAAPLFFDRSGTLIAGNITTYSVYANAKLMPHKAKAVRALVRCFPDLDKKTLERRFESQKGFVWIKRHITPKQRQALLSLGLPGVFLQKDIKRVYPQKNLFSHVLGMTDVDGRGVCGLEKAYAKRKGAVRTSLDSRMQHVVRSELLKSIQEFQAVAGNAVLLDAQSGEILAMVSLPDFDPNNPNDVNRAELFNRNAMGVYEFGSVFKVHNVAMALEQGTAHLGSVYDASMPLRTGRFSIQDFRGRGGQLTLQEAFLRSSNIANAKIALDAGITRQKNFFKKVGLFDRISLALPEMATPLVPRTWRQSTLMTASYGYGVSITPLHLARSIATIVTGFNVPLTLEQRQSQALQRQSVLRPQTVRNIRYLLKQAVFKGHAKKAHVPGYSIGAKTGTSNLLSPNGTYRKGENLVSCVGAFPIHNPRYVLLVSLEHPKPSAKTYGFATAGWIAAPAFRNIFTRLMPLLNVLPSKDVISH
jgi:cell division protein FtsI (penicillin-binding protein 3)